MTKSNTPPARQRQSGKPLDPSKLDVEGFARAAGTLDGELQALTLGRLAEMAADDAPASGWPAVRWQARGEQRAVRGGEPQVWLHLQAQAEVSLCCQRCLQPVRLPLELEREYRFVRDEELAASEDVDAEEDVLSLGGRFDLIELIEDELLMALPLVPRHERCPQPLPMPQAEVPEVEAAEEQRPNPFAALAALKGKGRAQ